MRSLRKKMLVFILTPVIALSLIIALVTYFQVKTNAVDSAARSTKNLVESKAALISERINAIAKEIKSISDLSITIDALKYGNWKEFVEDELKPKVAKNPYYESLFIAYPDGKAITTFGVTANISNRDYFKKIMKQGADIAISDGLISKATGQNVFVVAVAVKDQNNRTIGLLGASVKSDSFDDLLDELNKITQSAFAWIADSSGLIISDTTGKYLMKLNIKEASKAGMPDLEKTSKQILAGESGYFKSKRDDGSTNYVYYTPIKAANGWAVAVAVPENELLANTNKLIKVVIMMFVILNVAIAIIIFFVALSFTKPLNKLAETVIKFGKGDLTVQFETKGNDEIAHMAKELHNMADLIREAMTLINKASIEVNESASELSAVAEELGASSEEMLSQMEEANKATQNMSASIEEVTSGVEEVAASVQTVSKAAEQLSERSEQVAEAVKEGDKAIEKIAQMIKEARGMGEETVSVVDDLSNQVKNIGVILEAINSIAEQTNLLALNAAIEAARAGEAGKGFAVVADEIRKLAEESKNATTKIGQILEQISQGAIKADEATKRVVELVENISDQSDTIVKQFEKITYEVTSMSTEIESLAASAQEQGAAAEEISSAMDMSSKSMMELSQQIEGMLSVVNQQTGATQNVSALAQELSSLASELNDLIQKFKI
ncbi:methyl-accepting chemotaxis protein [Thermosipho globiformans]|uniref:methyl-accepting chemotaxis protein n=1 Tax=Thermosipho globiformans TaxID=380685 RepID=UPI000F8D0F9E|nr:methyl-accepting chemotaxis protein [Thermosipho globiformans]